MFTICRTEIMCSSWSSCFRSINGTYIGFSFPKSSCEYIPSLGSRTHFRNSSIWSTKTTLWIVDVAELSSGSLCSAFLFFLFNLLSFKKKKKKEKKRGRLLSQQALHGLERERERNTHQSLGASPRSLPAASPPHKLLSASSQHHSRTRREKNRRDDNVRTHTCHRLGVHLPRSRPGSIPACLLFFFFFARLD